MAAIERSRVRHSFDTHATGYESHARVQKRVVQRLAELLDGEGHGPRRVLDIGAGTGRLLEEIASRYPRAWLAGIDLAFRMARASRNNIGESAHIITGDAEQLPFATGVFDLVVSTSMFQWLDALDAAFAEALRVMAPGGSFRFALFGYATLFELRSAYRRSHALIRREEETRTHSFPLAAQVESALDRCGFIECKAWSELEITHYPDVPTLLRAIRGIGAGVTTPPTSSGLAERRIMLTMMDIYRQEYAVPAGIPATYEVVYGAGRKPEESRTARSE